MPRAAIEAVVGYSLFSRTDPDGWNPYLENLGKLCAEAWLNDLPERDREWAETHREKFGRWVTDSPSNSLGASGSAGSRRSGPPSVDARSVPPWPMLLEALKSAFLAAVESLKKEPADQKVRAPFDTETHVHQTYLWLMLVAGNASETLRPPALRAFRRGFWLGRRGEPSSLIRPISPMLDPPYFWGAVLRDLTGPRAERDRALRGSWLQTKDPKEYSALQEGLRELYASVWREEMPEDDREWAQTYYDVCSDWANRDRRRVISQSAYEGYLRSSNGVFNGEPATPWKALNGHLTEAWASFTDRVEDAPEGENELATAEAATREYWDALYREAPPWASDPAQIHWLAAVRATRAAMTASDTSAPAAG